MDQFKKKQKKQYSKERMKIHQSDQAKIGHTNEAIYNYHIKQAKKIQVRSKERFCKNLETWKQ